MLVIKPVYRERNTARTWTYRQRWVWSWLKSGRICWSWRDRRISGRSWCSWL